jgi:hypothetical protein
VAVFFLECLSTLTIGMVGSISLGILEVLDFDESLIDL